MMFASKTPSDHNQDPEPYVVTYNGENARRVTAAYASMLDTPFENNYDERVEMSSHPRPEFDLAQHNEPNPVLTAFRQIDAGRGEYADWVRDFDERPEFWTRGHNGTPSRFPQYTPAQVAHARRVLSRLAALATVAA